METRQCKATAKRTGERCKRRPVIGATVCPMHGGKAPRVAKNARQRVAEAQARQILGTIDPDAPPEHPVETLLALIQQKRAEIIWLRSIVKEMTEPELTWGTTERRHGIGPEGRVDVETLKAEQNIWWKLLRTAEDQLAGWTAAAAKAGIDERIVRLNEETAGVMVGVINRLLAHLQLEVDADKAAREFVAKAFREISDKKVKA